MPQPVSPYGVTKLAGEHLCLLYHANFELPTVALRYFTVYGARQRPDMAFHRFIHAAFAGEPITVHEDGEQTRDFTHVSDVVNANVLAGERDEAIGHVYNVAGGSRVTLRHVLAALEGVTGREFQISYAPAQAGDVRDTYADVSAARRDLGFEPTTSIDVGIRDEVDWYKNCVLTGVDSAFRG
jgi:UDP-glucose 4-epimerase